MLHAQRVDGQSRNGHHSLHKPASRIAGLLPVASEAPAPESSPSHCRAGRQLLERLDEIGKPVGMDRTTLMKIAVAAFIDRNKESSIDEAVAGAIRTPMTFRVGTLEYRLVISSGAIFAAGREICGACIEPARAILLSGTIRPDMRLRCLMQHLTAAWTFFAGTPRTTGEWAWLNSNLGEAAMRDLMRQGGEEALTALGVAHLDS